MSISSENLSYLGKLQQLFPAVFKKENIWALVCVGDNLDDPCEGWSGFSLVNVYEVATPFDIFFGHMSEKLMTYENIAPFHLLTGMSKAEAFRMLRDIITTASKSPVIVSSNAHTWVEPILNGFSTPDEPCPCPRNRNSGHNRQPWSVRWRAFRRSSGC